VEDWAGRCLHIRVHLWWGPRWSRRLLVVTGARCLITKPVVAAVGLCVDHRAPLQPGRAARRYLRAYGTSRAGRRRSGAVLVLGLQALPIPAAALLISLGIYFKRTDQRSHTAINSGLWRQHPCGHLCSLRDTELPSVTGEASKCYRRLRTYQHSAKNVSGHTPR
jgi:hypothetical protein